MLYGKLRAHHVSEGAQKKFDKVFIHPEFKPFNDYDDYDLAILRFAQPLRQLSDTVSPICIPESSKVRIPEQFHR